MMPCFHRGGSSSCWSVWGLVSRVPTFSGHVRMRLVHIKNFFFWIFLFKSKSDCIYHFLINLEPNEVDKIQEKNFCVECLGPSVPRTYLFQTQHNKVNSLRRCLTYIFYPRNSSTLIIIYTENYFFNLVNSVSFQVNRKIVNTIWFWFDNKIKKKNS